MTLRRFVLVALATVGACNRGGPSREEKRALTDALLQHGAEDQSGREQIPRAVMNRDTAFLQRLARADSTRSLWLRDVVGKYGWPSRALVGDSAARAAWLILQHTQLAGFQEEMLPRLDSAAARGEMPKQDVALLTDRVRVHQGKGQLYASQFSLKDGQMVPDSVEDLAHVDERRAALGLPPMAEYAQTLGKMYGVPVVWPPKR
jgi:hypothetical protein